MRYTKLLGVIVIFSSVFMGAIIYFSPFEKGSVVVEPNCRLGNQMFQYAAAYALAKETNSKLYVIVSRKRDGKVPPSTRDFPLEKFNIPQESIIYKDQIHNRSVFKGINLDKILAKITNSSIKESVALSIKKLNLRIREFFDIVELNEINFFDYYKKKNRKILYLSDNFESEIYFENHKDDILKIFSIKDIDNLDLVKKISTVKEDNAVCVHVRRGDMTRAPEFFMPIDYQKKAIELVNGLIQDPKFFILSDSPEMVKEELGGYNNVTFVEGTFWEDFIVMSKCKNIIVANSTFSWWAAYLNQEKEHLVVAPYPRVNDLFLIGVSDINKRFVKRNLYKYHAYPKHWYTIEYTK